MRPPADLPAELRAGPFSIHDAQRAGVRAGRLDARDLTIPFPGVRDHKDAGSYGLLRQCQQFAARIAPWQFFSHGTALALWGAPMPSDRSGSEVHVSAHRPQREPRVKGVIGHRLQYRDAAVHLIGGLPVESPARAWRQAGASWSLDDLVAAGDYLVGRGRCATLEELRCEAAAMGRGGRGAVARRARCHPCGFGVVRGVPAAPGAGASRSAGARAQLGAAGRERPVRGAARSGLSAVARRDGVRRPAARLRRPAVRARLRSLAGHTPRGVGCGASAAAPPARRRQTGCLPRAGGVGACRVVAIAGLMSRSRRE